MQNNNRLDIEVLCHKQVTSLDIRKETDLRHASKKVSWRNEKEKIHYTPGIV